MFCTISSAPMKFLISGVIVSSLFLLNTTEASDSILLVETKPSKVSIRQRKRWNTMLFMTDVSQYIVGHLLIKKNSSICPTVF